MKNTNLQKNNFTTECNEYNNTSENITKDYINYLSNVKNQTEAYTEEKGNREKFGDIKAILLLILLVFNISLIIVQLHPKEELLPEIDSHYAMAWSNKGADLALLGKYDEVVRAFDRAIVINLHYATAWSNKSAALASLGKYDDAIKAANKAIKFDPELAVASGNKGEALRKQGEYEEAIKILDQATELDPNLADAWNNKGEALNALGLTAEANEAFAKAKEPGKKADPSSKQYV